MESGNARIVALAALLIVAISAAGLILALNSGGSGSNTISVSEIAFLQISGNSSDVLFPELDYAEFTPLGEQWFGELEFLNDSEDLMHPEIYTQNCTLPKASLYELLEPLSSGIQAATTSEFSSLTILENDSNVAWTLDIRFSDSSWVYLLVMLAQPYTLYLSGTGTPNHNLLNAAVLEPSSVFNSLAAAIQELITEVIS